MLHLMSIPMPANVNEKVLEIFNPASDPANYEKITNGSELAGNPVKQND